MFLSGKGRVISSGHLNTKNNKKKDECMDVTACYGDCTISIGF